MKSIIFDTIFDISIQTKRGGNSIIPAKIKMTKKQLETLRLSAIAKINNNQLAGVFRKSDSANNGYDLNGELVMTGTNEQVLSNLKNKAFQNKGIYETVGEYIVVTTDKFQYIGKLIK